MSGSEIEHGETRLRLVDSGAHPIDAQRTSRQRASGPAPKTSIRAVVVLAGSVRQTPLRRRSGRSPLAMPVGANRTVLDCWREQLTALAKSLELEHLPVRVMVSSDCGLSPITDRFGPVELSIEVDPSAFRGTAGLLSDVARAYEDDDQLLVIHGGQLLFTSLTQVTHELARCDAMVGMATCPQGVPSGVMLMRCGGLREVAKVGFVDLNEQVLPELAKTYPIKIRRRETLTTMSVRTLSGYIAALRTYHRRATGHQEIPSPFAEAWRPTFGIVESGASVDPSAVIHDAVVLAGARVEAGAVVVRSVICPGAVVGRDQHIVDRVFGEQSPAGK